MSAGEEIRSKGFTILRGVFDADTLARLREFLERLIPQADNAAGDPFLPWYLPHRTDQGVLYDLFQRHPEFTDFARNSQILDSVAEVLGLDLFVYENSLVYKPAGRKNGVPFHQDFISRPHEPKKLIAWMAIDDVRKDNGALKIVPGSHVKGFLPWYRVQGETHHDRLDLSSIDTSKVEHVELDAGDVLVFDQLVVHGSDEAHGDELRLVYRVSYQGFDEIFVPRASPIVVRGGGPEALSSRFANYRPESDRRGPITKLVNRIGTRLGNINLRI